MKDSVVFLLGLVSLSCIMPLRVIGYDFSCCDGALPQEQNAKYLLVQLLPVLIRSSMNPYPIKIYGETGWSLASYPVERGGRISKKRKRRDPPDDTAEDDESLLDLESEPSSDSEEEIILPECGDCSGANGCGEGSGDDEGDDEPVNPCDVDLIDLSDPCDSGLIAVIPPDDEAVETTELPKTLSSIEAILRNKDVKLILSLDIDGTISYGEDKDKEHKPYFQILREYMEEHRERWLWIYNTSRTPISITDPAAELVTLRFDDWKESFPAPDVLIMGGGEIIYSPRLKQSYPGLKDRLIDETKIVQWPLDRLKFIGIVPAVAKDYIYYTYLPGRAGIVTTEVLLNEKQRSDPSRLGVWHRPPSGTVHGTIFGYDRYYNKGAALKQAIEALRKHNVLGDKRHSLITAGDLLPDISMMNSDLSFTFVQEDKAEIPNFPLPGLPLNVVFTGSVLPSGALLANAELKQELLSDTFTVDALEPNIIGIMDAVLTLLEVLQDTFD